MMGHVEVHFNKRSVRKQKTAFFVNVKGKKDSFCPKHDGNLTNFRDTWLLKKLISRESENHSICRKENLLHNE
jgi:hypothetical protein